jgi:hypothetical protein
MAQLVTADWFDSFPSGASEFRKRGHFLKTNSGGRI